MREEYAVEMAPRNPLDRGNRMRDEEELVVTTDSTAVRRGRRKAARTEVCRPCLVWLPDASEVKMESVVMDLNPHGMRLRMIDALPSGQVVMAQLMRDEAFQVPLSPPITAVVTRVRRGADGLVDHGLKIQHAKIKSAPAANTARGMKPSPGGVRGTRMHTADTLDARRTRRNRG